jgi:hypothetical protein
MQMTEETNPIRHRARPAVVEQTECKTCHGPFSAAPEAKNCGGDCLRCMAIARDPACVEEYHRILGSRMAATFGKDPLHVKHSELRRVGESAFRSACPECGIGILLMKREEKDDFRLSEADICISCARQFVYDDIDQVRGRTE